MKARALRTSVAAVGLVVAQVGIAAAAPQQLRCVLSGSEASAPIIVAFDEDAKTLRAQSGTQTYSFSNISISNVAISGSVGTVSLGIDRSSLGMVWQQYSAEKATIQFGQCQKTTSSTDQ
jgi:hypothetical protein